MTAVLVIAAGGLGRLVQALGALVALRIHHPGAHIVLLTAPDAALFAAETRMADEVWSDTSTGPWDWRALLDLRRQLRGMTFSTVYDLDGGPCGRRVFHLLNDWGLRRRADIVWCGPGKDRSTRGAAHIYDRLAAQLRETGVPEVPLPDLTWIARKVTEFNVPFRMNEPFVLIACDPIEGRETDPRAAWPSERWTMLAEVCSGAGLRPVLIGLRPAPDIADEMTLHLPRTIDLAGQISVSDMVFLAWAAKAAVGCDNGVMHLAAVANCRCIVLYDTGSDPAQVGQRGRDVTILRRDRVTDIPVSEVMAALQRRA